MTRGIAFCERASYTSGMNFLLAILVLSFFVSATHADEFAELQSVLRATIDRRERATPELQDRISRFEAEYAPSLSLEDRIAFQRLVGLVSGHLSQTPLVPNTTEAIWIRSPSRLHQYHSSIELPAEVDYLGIGAGLAGAGALAELAPWAKARGLSVAWVDAQGVGEGASGRNGGNFAMWTERFTGITTDGVSLDGESEGLLSERYKFLKAAHPDWSHERLLRRAKESALLQMRVGVKNAELLRENVDRMRIEADLSDAGWLRVADSPEDAEYLKQEAELANSLGVDTEWWDGVRVKNEIGIVAPWGARLVKGFGNYHPYKYVNGVFEWALEQGVQLHTQTRVIEIVPPSEPGKPTLVLTNRGWIRVRHRVLVFTDSYTDFIPVVAQFIQPMTSRVLNFPHAENLLQGMSVTKKAGDWYGNIPYSTWYVDENGMARGTLVLGGGQDTPVASAWDLDLDPEQFYVILDQAWETFPELNGRPPSDVSVGPFAFTLDGMSITGKLMGETVIGSVGSQGYGGTQSTLYGWYVAKMITAPAEELAELTATFAPQDHVGLARFTSCERLIQ